MNDICDLKSITTLTLHEVDCCTDDSIVSLVDCLPSLKMLMLYFELKSSNNITIDSLTDMVKYGKQLESIHLRGVRHF